MAQGAPADKRLGNLIHGDRALNARVHAFTFQGGLQRQRIDGRRQHAHVVARGAFDLEALLTATPEYISPADHDGYLYA